MAKKTTTKSKPEVAAKRAIKSEEKPKAVAPPASAPSPKAAAPAPAPVEAKPVASKPVASKPVKAAPKAKKVAVKKSPAAAKPPAFTQDDVALRAYFISEKRRSHGLPGDEHQDWLEAERQIIGENGKKKTLKKV